MHVMYDRMSLLVYVNDKDISRNIEFANHYFKNSAVQDFLAGIETIIPDSIHSEHNQTLLKSCQKIRESLSKIDLSIYSEEITRIRQSGTHFITFDSNQYPVQLNDLIDPPLLLYHKGNLMDFNNCVAIIGTRSPSEYGKQLARTLSIDFVKKGYTIVSGLALGIDTEAHRGALDAGGKTIAILAGHIDEIYPRENLPLVQEIIQSGAIISEVSPFVTTHKGRYISRNRLTSGLSQCVISVESHGGGGTLRQVTTAKSQGRPFFVCKPREGDFKPAKGYAELCKIGAIPISTAEEVINYLKNNAPLSENLKSPAKKRSSVTSLDQF